MEKNTAVVNLDPAFSPYGESDFKVKVFPFPSKVEMGVKIDIPEITPVTITTRLKSSDDIMTLLNATDALRQAGIKEISLFMPFVPYARQDRVMVPGEALSIKVFAKLINTQGYDRVTIFDPHSDVTPALIDNAYVINNHEFVKLALKDMENYIIISPDSGAFKKVFKVCQAIGYNERVALCNKVRTLANGNIEHLSFDVQSFEGKDAVIIDDICDGGATFIALATELKKRDAGKVHLIVSHGIFSRGVNNLLNSGVDTITTTDSFKDIGAFENVRQIKLAEIIKK